MHYQNTSKQVGTRGIGLTGALLTLTIATEPLLAYRRDTPIGNLSLGRVFLALTIISLWPRLVQHRLSRRGQKFVFAAFAYTLSLIFGIFYSSRPTVAITEIANVLEAFALFSVTIIAARDLHAHHSRLVLSMPYLAFLPSGIIGTMQAIQLAMGQHPTIPFIQFAQLDLTTDNAARTAFGTGLDQFGIDRVAGATGDPPTFGVLCASLIVYHVWLLRTQRAKSQPINVIILLTAILGVITSASLTAFLVMSAGIVSCLMTTRQGQPRQVLSMHLPAFSGRIIVTSALSLLMIYAFPKGQEFLQAALSRTTSFFEGTGSAESHTEILFGGLQIFFDNPVLGVGSGAGSTVYFSTPVTFSSFHDAFVLTAAEGGLIGLTALLVLVWTIARWFAPLPIAIAVISAWLFYLDLNRMPYLWGLMAVASVIAMREETGPKLKTLSQREGMTNRISRDPRARTNESQRVPTSGTMTGQTGNT